MGWFLGLKLHAIINSQGELVRIRLTPGNTDDRKPVPEMCEGLFGMLFADKGYLSKPLAETLQRIELSRQNSQGRPGSFSATISGSTRWRGRAASP